MYKSVICLLTFLSLPNLSRATGACPEGKGNRHINELRLSCDLLSNSTYQKHIRPVRNETEQVVVIVDIGIRNIIKLDEKRQILKSLVYITLSWNDEFLTWDTAKYDGLESTSLPAQSVWVPDLTIFNSMTSKQPFTITDSNTVFVRHTGEAMLSWRPSVLETTCNVDVYTFPKDTQTCVFLVGSWHYRDNKLYMDVYNSTMDEYIFHDNGEWLLQRTKLYKTRSQWGTVLESQYQTTQGRTFVVAEFTIKRKATLYEVTLVVPCLMLGCLGTLTFYIPYQYGVSKIERCATLFLSGLFFLQLLNKLLPATSDRRVSDIGIYYLSNLVIICPLAVFWNVFILNIDKLAVGKVPSWLKVLTNTTSKTSTKRKLKRTSNVRVGKKYRCDESLWTEDCLSNSKIYSVGEFFADINNGRNKSTVKEIADCIQRIDEHFSNREGENPMSDIRKDWHSVAVSLDQMAGFIFIASLIAINLYIAMAVDLPQNQPNHYDDISKVE
ncbi:neuronal acetylcholine receptor subunit alpha-3-like [Glandiceps talaboti]